MSSDERRIGALYTWSYRVRQDYHGRADEKHALLRLFAARVVQKTIERRQSDMEGNEEISLRLSEWKQRDSMAVVVKQIKELLAACD